MNFSKTVAMLAGLLLSIAASAKTIEMEVNGLVCAFCAQGIEKTLKSFPATEAVLVSLEHRLVAVALKDGTDIDDATLRQALTEAGYTVVDIRRTDASLEALRAGMKPHD
ncbi:MAG TPA: heavy-metal-associated domain-containing protein [Tahibacter sp.]|nr:heavy-metal-associated domain-containing protein [Tahibacter sp.]